MLRTLVLFAGTLTLAAGFAGGYYFWNLSHAESIAPEYAPAAEVVPAAHELPAVAVVPAEHEVPGAQDAPLALEAGPPPPAPAPRGNADLGIARVSYFFMHRSPENGDTLHERMATGAIFRDAEGALAVLVARSAVDGRWAAFDLAKAGEIAEEEISVEFIDGTAATAAVIWNAPGEADLALLRIAAGETAPEISAAPIRFDGNAGGTRRRVEARWFASELGIKSASAIWGADGSVTGLDERVVNAVLFVDGAAAGILPSTSRGSGPTGARAISFDMVPDSFRGGTK